MRRVVTAAAAALFFVLFGVDAGSASAANVVEVGWWTRSPAAAAPEGGIAVSNAPDGPVSVAAVRVDLGATGVSSAMIRIEQTGGAAPAGAQLVVCLVDTQWAKTAGGPMAEAPATTCTGTSAALTPNGTTWTANVGDLVGERKGTVSFSIVPTTGSSGVWELQLDTPTFQGTAASTPTTRSTATTAPRTTPTTAFTPRPATPTFVAPPPPVLTTTTVAITPTTVDNFVPNVAPSSEVAFGGARPEEGGREGRPVGQAITLVIVAVVVGVMGGVAHKVVSARIAA